MNGDSVNRKLDSLTHSLPRPGRTTRPGHLRRTAAFALAFVVITLLVASSPAIGQSCVLTRLDSPVLDPLLGDQKWEISFAWRYGKSDRHFVGTEEQVHRTEEGSQVINTVNLLDLGIRYQFNPRTSFHLGLPYLMANRTGPVSDGDLMVGRELRSSTRGNGDITAVFNRLVWDPETHVRGNLSWGVGLKLPTGENAMTGTRTRYVDGVPVLQVETADQSVQPGDGGLGLVLELSGYQSFNSTSSLSGYLSATYIVAPEGDSGVPTYRSREGEQVMSIADQYVARLGVQFAPASWGNFYAGFGARIEGIPVYDLIGSSEGFRRPGYMLSAEPWMTWKSGQNRVTVSLPISVVRDRQQSVSDKASGRHGDAAFPDYLILAGYSYRF